MTQKQARDICIFICVGYLILGLWPFNFLPRNYLNVLPNAEGIQFGPQSIAYSENSVVWAGTTSSPDEAGSVSIELWLESDSEPTGNVLPILSLYDGRLPENLLIGQWKSELLLRAFAWNAQGQLRRREMGVGSALQKGIRRFIAITSGSGGTAFYVDGAPEKIYPRLTLRSDSLRGQLILGNIPGGGHSWTGKLSGLAVFDVSLNVSDILRHDTLWTGHHLRELSSDPGLTALYLFDAKDGAAVRDYSPSKATLVIPKLYHVLRKSILIPPWRDWATSFSHFEDIAVNTLGFVPFGFFFLIYMSLARPERRFRNAALTVLVAGIISAAIELTQVLLPSRSSSLTDVICNIVGAIVGTLIATQAPWLSRRRA